MTTAEGTARTTIGRSHDIVLDARDRWPGGASIAHAAAAPAPVTFDGVAGRLMKRGKPALIRGALDLLYSSQAWRLDTGAAGLGVIFTLHQVRPAVARTFAPNAHLEITPEFLDAAIRATRDSGIEIVAIADLPSRLRAGGRRIAAFTLDDGYRDNAEHAYPVFKRHDVPFTVFAATGFIDRTRSSWWKTLEQIVATRDRFRFDPAEAGVAYHCASAQQKQAVFDAIAGWVLSSADEDAAVAAIDRTARAYGSEPLDIVDNEIMSPDELRTLAQEPLASIGAHTVTHVNLKRVSHQRLKDELNDGADRLAQILGARPATMAYPYGFDAAVGAREAHAAQTAGYGVAVTTMPGTLRPAHAAQPALLPRVSLNGLFQRRRYVDVMLSGLPFALTPAPADA